MLYKSEKGFVHTWPILEVPTPQEGKWGKFLSHPFKNLHSLLIMWTCSTTPWVFQELWTKTHVHKTIRSWGKIRSRGLKQRQTLVLSIAGQSRPHSWASILSWDNLWRHDKQTCGICPKFSRRTEPDAALRHLLWSPSPGRLRAHAECACTARYSFGGKNKVYDMSLNGISRAAEKRRKMCLPGPFHQWHIVNHPAQRRLTAQEILQHAKPSACHNWDIQSISPPCRSPPPQPLLLSSLPINKTFHYWVMKIKIRQVSHPPWYYSALSSASSSSSTHLKPWRLKKIHQHGSQSDGATCIPVGNRAKTVAFLSVWSWELHCCTDFNQEILCTFNSTFYPPMQSTCWRCPTGAIAPTLPKWEWRMVFQ